MQDQYSPSTIISEEHSQQLERLTKQLNTIKSLADSSFWLSTDELVILLNLDHSFVEKLNFEVGLQNQNYGFLWRNFECKLVECQFAKGFWTIRNRQDLLKSPDNHSLQIIQESQLLTKESLTVDVAIAEEIIPTPYALIENFLSSTQLSELLQYSIRKHPEFVPTQNSENNLDYRRSFYLPHFPEFSELMINLVRKITPQIITHLGIPNFAIGNIESQLTAHNHGNYYKIHNDSGSPEAKTRVLTYVFYYHREPKSFTGGELVLYDSKIENGFYVAAKSHQIIPPTNNTIIFFPSHCLHEVLPVNCPSEYFADSRFTINGWVRHV